MADHKYFERVTGETGVAYLNSFYGRVMIWMMDMDDMDDGSVKFKIGDHSIV